MTKHQHLTVKLSADEIRRITLAAKLVGLSRHAWMRSMLIVAANGRKP